MEQPTFPEWLGDWADHRPDTIEPSEPDDAVWVERPVDEPFEDEPVSES